MDCCFVTSKTAGRGSVWAWCELTSRLLGRRACRCEVTCRAAEPLRSGFSWPHATPGVRRVRFRMGFPDRFNGLMW